MNIKNHAWEFRKVIDWIHFLIDVNDSWSDIKLAKNPDDVDWEGERDRLFGEYNVAKIIDSECKLIEQITQSNIAKSWQSSLPSGLRSPNDGHIQSIMITRQCGLKDPDQFVLSNLQTKLGLKASELARITIPKFPLNKFEENHKILSGAFPIVFPCGVTDKELGTSGQVPCLVSERLLCCVDFRFAIFYFLFSKSKITSSGLSECQGEDAS